MPTLLDIGRDLLDLADKLEEATGPDGEIDPEAAADLDAWFAELGDQRDRKLEGYCTLIKATEYDAEAFARRAKAAASLHKRLKDTLKLFCETQGVKKIQTDRYRISVCANGGKQPLEVLAEPTSLPIEFQKITITADNEKLRAAVEAGQELPGVKLLPRGSHIRIS